MSSSFCGVVTRSKQSTPKLPRHVGNRFAHGTPLPMHRIASYEKSPSLAVLHFSSTLYIG